MRPAVSVGFQASLDYKPVNVSAVDGFPYSIQPPDLFDEIAVDHYFDLSEFPDSTESVLVDATQDFFNSSFITQDSLTNPYGLCDQLGAKHFDLQADSGATNFVSDETRLAAEV